MKLDDNKPKPINKIVTVMLVDENKAKPTIKKNKPTQANLDVSKEFNRLVYFLMYDKIILKFSI